jgi:hypothetical protein
MAFARIEELDTVIEQASLKIEAISHEAFFLAGKVFLVYRKSLGTKHNVLPDSFYRRARSSHAVADLHQGRRPLSHTLSNGPTNNARGIRSRLPTVRERFTRRRGTGLLPDLRKITMEAGRPLHSYDTPCAVAPGLHRKGGRHPRPNFHRTIKVTSDFFIFARFHAKEGLRVNSSYCMKSRACFQHKHMTAPGRLLPVAVQFPVSTRS